MAGDWPSIDPRGASKLRETLEKSAPMLAPDWTGLRHEGDFGRALIEIAARLAEHSTSRLERTPFRDKLAFLDALDVATPAPRPASVPIVFTLAEKRETPVFAPARAQLSAKGEKETIDFETREALMLTPARLASLIAADPAADRIERAPAFVTGGLAEAAPPTRYLLLSAVEVGAKALQLVQAVGIKPDDLLRFGGTAYRVEKVDGAIVKLRDPVAAPAAAGAEIEKLVALEAFDLRNLQEHAAYFGHKEMLKLDGQAEITLVFDPPALASQLARLDVEFAMWGTPSVGSDPVPDWQVLKLIGASGRGLRLAKAWDGGVDEREVAGCSSRWIRLRLNTPILGVGGPPTGAVSVALKVESAGVKDDKPEGSQTIAAAFYNGQPLPTSSAFFPFGPEPQRFDIFSFSAPEALSKKGARVTLRIGLDDASLHSMAYAEGDSSHVYGVSANGRLQSVRFRPPKPDWRALGLAPEKTDARAAAAAERTVRLDPKAPIHVLCVDANSDLVFVSDQEGLIRSARIDSTDSDWTVGEWRTLPSASGKAFVSFCLISARRQARGADPVIARLLAATKDAFYVRTIEASGSTASTWAKVESNLAPGDSIAIALAQARPAGATIAAIDSEGKIHRGEYDFAKGEISWDAFADAAGLDPRADRAVRPLAWLEREDLVVLAARSAINNPDREPLLLMHEEDGQRDPPHGNLAALLGSPKSIQAVDWPGDDGPARPLILVTGTAGILIWAEGPADVVALPRDANPDNPYGLLLPATAQLPPSLLLNAGSELLLHETIWIGATEVNATLHDIVWRAPGEPSPTHVMIDSGSTPELLAGPWLSNDFELANAVPAGALGDGDEYVLLQDLKTGFTGTARDPADDKQMPLAPGDDVTAALDYLEIDGETYLVETIEGTPAVATVDRALPTGTIDYTIYRPTEAARTFATADRAGIAEIDISAPAGADEIIFPAPADPAHQPILAAEGRWLLMRYQWDDEPQTGQAMLTSQPRLDPHAQIRLPREADNPELSWDYFDGDGWRRLDSKAEWGFTDGTLNLAKSGEVSFQVPKDLAPTEIAGKDDYWIRARLEGGDYGRSAYIIVNDPKPPAETSRTSITIDRSRLNPPEILSIEATYVLEKAVPPDCVVADNNLAAIDQTQAALEEGAVFDLFEGVAQHVHDADGGSRAFYLGFSRKIGVPALNLYADAVDLDSAPRALIAEALTRDGWRTISTKDETAALTRPGMLRLFLHPQPEQLPLFGRDGWWLRLRPGQDAAGWAPVLRGLFVNAVMAEHAKTVRQEILGSSLGEPKQSHRLAQAPVLRDTLELRVRESLGPEECEAIEKSGGKDAIKDDDPNLPGQWVLWRRVETFVDQDGDARVYRLAPASGEISFGDGRSGKIPPAGRDSIRAFSYQKGGGSTGNVAARTIDTLSSAIESVEQAINPVGSSGGADAPLAERLATTAPALLRCASRALAPADIETLAVESAPDVVRARCLPRGGCGIALVVAIRETGTRCPVPTRARREGIAANIVAAGWGALAPDSVTVRPPRYVRVAVHAVAMATSAEAVAGVDRAVRAALTDFLHPVEGGPDGRGWPFGRRVWRSDVQRAIAHVEGLDRLIALDLTTKDPNESLDAMPPDGLVCVGEDDISLFVGPPEDGR